MRNSVFTLLIIALFHFTSCTNEESGLTGLGKTDKEKVAFFLPGTAVQAKSGEAVDRYNILMHELMICVFHEETGRLESIFHTDDIALNCDGKACVASIDIDIVKSKGSKVFYVLANCKDKSTKLHELEIGVTRIDDMEELLTDPDVNPNNGTRLSSGKTKISDISLLDQPVHVEMECRVARFDLDDSLLFDEFRINKVQIKNTTQQTYIFSKKSRIGDHLPINTVDYYLDNFMDQRKFYLYPGMFDKGRTEIYFEGVLNGEETMYHLSIPSDVRIEADKRYTFMPKIIDGQIIDGEIKVESRSIPDNQSVVQIGIVALDYTTIDTDIIL